MSFGPLALVLLSPVLLPAALIAFIISTITALVKAIAWLARSTEADYRWLRDRFTSPPPVARHQYPPTRDDLDRMFPARGREGRA
jgi:hypothetical protein